MYVLGKENALIEIARTITSIVYVNETIYLYISIKKFCWALYSVPLFTQSYSVTAVFYKKDLPSPLSEENLCF